MSSRDVHCLAESLMRKSWSARAWLCFLHEFEGDGGHSRLLSSPFTLLYVLAFRASARKLRA